MRRIVFFIGCCLMVACNEKIVEPPEGLIPKEDMVHILYDLSLLNAAKNTNPEVLRDNNIETMDYLYKKYGIDSVLFVKSDLYYASIPSEYEGIYTDVEALLEETKKIFEEERRRQRDSVVTTSDLIKSERKRIVKDSLQ